MLGSPFATGAADVESARRGMGGSVGVAATILIAVDSRRSLTRPDRTGDTGGSTTRVARASGRGVAGAATTGGAGAGATATGGGAAAGATGAGESGGRSGSGPTADVTSMGVGSGASAATHTGPAGVRGALRRRRRLIAPLRAVRGLAQQEATPDEQRGDHDGGDDGRAHPARRPRRARSPAVADAMARLGARQLPVASSTTAAVTRSIPRTSARRSARPHIRLIICGMPVRRGGDPLDRLGREGMGAALHRPPAEVEIPADTVGVERRQTTADRFASRRAAEAERVELRLEQGLAHQQDREIGPRDEQRNRARRAGRSTGPAPRRGPRRHGVRVRRQPGGPASRRGPAGDPRSPSSIPREPARPRAGAAARSCRCPAGR